MKKVLWLVGLALCILTARSYGYAEELRIDGSTTVLPIAQKAAEVFMKKYPNGKVFVSGSGSGTGIKALIDGTTMIATSSREAKKEELEAAKAKGVNMTEHKVAYDGVVPIAHPSNPLDTVTLQQLRDIYNGKIKSWKEMGGPDRPLSVVSRDTSSGTYEVWEEKVLKKDKVRADALMVASSGQMDQTVAQNRVAIGYTGIGYLDKTVKALKIDGKAATESTVRDFSWPVSRPLYMYTNGKPTGVVARFIDFMLSAEGQQVVKDVKFVSLR